MTIYGSPRIPEPPGREPEQRWTAASEPDQLSHSHEPGPPVRQNRRGLRAGAIAVAFGLAALGGAAGVAAGRNGSDPVWRNNAGPVATPSAVGPSTASSTGGTITLSGVGDVIMGTLPGSTPPNGGAGFFNPVKQALAADLVMGNLETPLTEDTGRVKCVSEVPSPTPDNPSPRPTRVSGCHQFYLPPSYAQHLKDGGFGLMSLANNHTNDMGQAGLRNTRAALEAVGIQHTGAPGQITVVEVKGLKVAVLGFAIYGWTQSLNNIPAAKRLVEDAAGQADIVVVQMQGGAEGSDKSHVKPGHEIFLGEDRGDLMAFSRAVIDSGADVVFGHGPHIMRGMEFYQGRLIAYSLGNFCGYEVLRGTGYLGVGGVLKVTLNRDGSWARGTLVPTVMTNGGYAAPDSRKRAISFVAGLSRDDFGDNAAAIAADGTIRPPAR